MYATKNKSSCNVHVMLILMLMLMLRCNKIWLKKQISLYTCLCLDSSPWSLLFEYYLA